MGYHLGDMHPEALLQLARILGRQRFYQRLGLGEGAPLESLTQAQADAVRRLADEHTSDIARALLEEAAACDDVIDSQSALAYLEDRLSFFGDLLSDRQKARIRQEFGQQAARWDSP